MKGEEVKKILRANGITHKMLADSFGTTVQNIGSLLSKDDVRTGLLEDISKATGIPLQDFFVGTKGAIKFNQVAEPNTVPLLPIFALDEEYTTHYPFRKFQIRTEETRKKALTVEQVRAYMDVPGPNEYRDVFLLMLYLRGINVGDLADLTWADVKDGRVEYRRNKTGHLYSIRIEPEAQAIIDRWRGERHLLAVFDRYKEPHDYNRRLREALKKMEGPDGKPIEPDCSSNWARHTWATIAAEIDVPDPTISLGMGHRIAGHRTTAIYIRRDQRKVDEANRAVIDYIKDRGHLTAAPANNNP